MAKGDDVTQCPALAGRLLRVLGLPPRPRQYHLQRGCQHRYGYCPGVFASGPEAATIDTIVLELNAWPSSPAATEPKVASSASNTTDINNDHDYDSCHIDSPQTTTGRRCSQSSPSNRPQQGHRRANSFDSTNTDSSTASSSRSRWDTPSRDGSTASSCSTKHVEDRRSRESRKAWREYW
ncbi:hypothetical protein CDEST_14616 [Colletotrichum destructivum]|uniref:Uncharacterized protein n=1 Tax=Colletotrichum destructivum TaxID=34406 RepID=A0AAX4J219_9PEZI|nr:hypothetical protein CDEST_14616 [Colletotrichum destructivum]